MAALFFPQPSIFLPSTPLFFFPLMKEACMCANGYAHMCVIVSVLEISWGTGPSHAPILLALAISIG